MFKKRKRKNRRFERKHVLKVKLTTSQRRNIRGRKILWSLSLTFLLLFSGYMAWRGGEALIDWAVLKNHYFDIHQIEVETDGIIRKEQIRQWAGVRPGMNLFTLNLTRVRRDLELIPSIASSEIERVLPGTIKIRIREREAVAQLALPELDSNHHLRKGTYTIDSQGYFMIPLQPYQCRVPQDGALKNLPYLVGVHLNELRPGYQIESAQIRAALDLVLAFKRSSMAGLVDLHQIDLQTPGILKIKTTRNTRVTCAPDQLDRQMQRWRTLHDMCSDHGKRMISLDLSVTNNVPMIWADRFRTPANNRNPIKPQQYRNKNV